jgi:3-methylfumaryl-CoA hydratase
VAARGPRRRGAPVPVFNAHRIPYDRPYATGVEGHAGLVVHGPLQATLLGELARGEAAAGRRMVEFSFQAVQPAIAGRPLRLLGAPAGDGGRATLWAQDPDGAITLQAEAGFSAGA